MDEKNVGDSEAVHRYFFQDKGFWPGTLSFPIPLNLCRRKRSVRRACNQPANREEATGRRFGEEIKHGLYRFNALGIEVDSPEWNEDLQRIARQLAGMP